MSAVYDVGYDTRKIKTRKNIVTVRLLAALKKTISQDRSHKKFQDFETHCYV